MVCDGLDGPTKGLPDSRSTLLSWSCPGRHFVVALRLYGTGHAFYDQTCIPDDFVKID